MILSVAEGYCKIIVGLGDLARALVIVVSACSAKIAPTPSPPGLAPIRLALADEGTVRFAVVVDGEVRVTRTVDAPGMIAQLDWVGADPVVRIGQDQELDHGVPVASGGRDPNTGEIARITANGYEPFPRLPEATWQSVQPDAGQERLEAWGLVSGADGSIWQGYCGNGFYADGGLVCGLMYARLAPAPVITTTSPKAAPDPGLPFVEPPSEPKVELVQMPPSSDEDEAQTNDKKILRCVDHGKTIEYPADDERSRDFLGMGPVTWLSADPPLFRVAADYLGFAVVERSMTFQRCENAETYGTDIATGPDELVALYGGDTFVVFQHGRIVGKAATSARFVRFAPR
jgi:hypothetical protein